MEEQLFKSNKRCLLGRSGFCFYCKSGAMTVIHMSGFLNFTVYSYLAHIIWKSWPATWRSGFFPILSIVQDFCIPAGECPWILGDFFILRIFSSISLGVGMDVLTGTISFIQTLGLDKQPSILIKIYFCVILWIVLWVYYVTCNSFQKWLFLSCWAPRLENLKTVWGIPAGMKMVQTVFQFELKMCTSA